MKTASAQIDLLDDAPGHREAPRPAPRKRSASAPALPAGWNEEEAAQRLEQGGRYRILRKLVPRAVIPRAESAFPNLAVLVDTETTGLNHAKDEIIEIGAVAFTYDDDEGAVGDVVGIYSGLRLASPPGSGCSARAGRIQHAHRCRGQERAQHRGQVVARQQGPEPDRHQRQGE